MRRGLTRPLPWALAVLAALVWGLPHLGPVFAAMFPGLERPLYEQDSFAELTWAHLRLVGLSSAAATVAGVLAGTWVTRASGREFRPAVETLVAMGQTFPPVAVLAIAVPLIGFGEAPALIALTLYGLLPILRQTLAGLASVPAPALEAARGLGLRPAQVLWRVEWPLALPVILTGVRSSVIINVGTATIASTVGARTLGSPIIVGLDGFNTAYVLQGALLVGWLAVTVDLAFAQVLRRVDRWQAA